ncbi:MAG: glycosyltransferase family 4 protein [Bacteroidetes bacterium]|nr:glycosyltransferase family 4 protein [Bacteroidota bacterium]
MNIAVNTRFLIKDSLEGIGWFTFETLKRITQSHPEHRFIFLFDRPYSDEFIFSKNVIPQVVNPPARHPFLWYYWFQHGVPRALRKHKADLFLSTDGYLTLNKKVKSLVVMHDLAFEHYPADLPLLARNYYRYYSKRFAKRANRIATVSEYTKKDIIDTYRISHAKIDVVHNGSNELFKPMSEQEKEDLKEKYTDGCDYFIYAGALHPRKNIYNLLAAFEHFKESRITNLKLVLAGRMAWGNARMIRYYEQMKFKEDVIFMGNLLLDELPKMVAASTAMVYISYFEGFGIPLLEAMNCDVPVITSNVTSLPEVAGPAALLVDPFSVEDISNAMLTLENDEDLRQEMILKGREQRQKFSWNRTAEKLWNSVESVLAI